MSALSIRSRALLALGIPAAAVSSLAACAAADRDRDVVMAPLVPPVIDAGIDASSADADTEAGGEGGSRKTTRALREPVSRAQCKRNVRCRPPDDEEQAVPYPDPFAHCAPALAKDKRDAPFSPKETKGARAHEPDVCCYVEFHSCENRTIQIMEGRALRADGEVQRPRTSERRGNTSRVAGKWMGKWMRKWMRAAENEHASIATFARLTLELLALGAPMELVLGCQQAGAEEVTHAQEAYALLSSFAGEELHALPFAEACAPIVPDVLRLARETLLDGCVGETAAALVAMRDAELERDPAVKAVLHRVARDESSHAELAFKLLAWTIQVGGATVHDALRQDLAALTRDAAMDNDPRSLALHTVTAPVVSCLLTHEGS